MSILLLFELCLVFVFRFRLHVNEIVTFYLCENKRAKLKNTLFLSKFNLNGKMHRLIMPAFIDLINACMRIG